MRQRVSTLAVAAFVLSALGGIAQESATLSWHDNYADALAEARETGKPLFVEFRCVP